MDSDLRVKSITVDFEPCVARTPLKFGGVVMDSLDFCRVQATVENRRGKTATGWGGIFMADSWAWPTAEVDNSTKTAVMEHIVQAYADSVLDVKEFAHPIDTFMTLETQLAAINDEAVAEFPPPLKMTFLGALVCASPVDAALHDAFGNVNGIDSYDGYGPDFMSDLSRYLGPEGAGKYVQDYLRPEYLPEVPVFHLVGGLDKLTRAEKDGNDPQDGGPVSLDEWIAQDGVFCLKVKLRGVDLPWDIERVLAVYEVGREALAKQGQEELWLTADTNEMCESPDYLVEMLKRVQEKSPECYDRLLYLEQPTERDLEAHRFDMRELSKLKPVLLDESLTSLEMMDLGLELGWSGIALKTCKGHSMDMILAAKARELGVPYALQDLTNPSLALIHAVGMGARLYTMMGLEANSRQFFPAATPPGEQAVHEGLFRIHRGMASTASLQGTGLGYQMDKVLSYKGD
ncbi:MAG: mandelate racemase/muconate lactonizing enzyme family protein [candidate division WS1 bacterium]|nr:mandelate racemase/muconate lactonizing enzyme family protein [candidate division WS1 bacterium]